METSATMMNLTVEKIEADFYEEINALMSVIEDAVSQHCTGVNFRFGGELSDSLEIKFMKRDFAKEYLRYYGYKVKPIIVCNPKRNFWNGGEAFMLGGYTVDWDVD